MPSPSFFTYTFPWLNYEMFLVNSKITQPHHWGSRYPQWVVNARGVAYWGAVLPEDGIYGERIDRRFWHCCGRDRLVDVCVLIFPDPKIERSIYLLGNPFAVWMTSAGIVTFIVLGVSFFHLKHFVKLPRSYGRSLGLAR
jgi:dolichyl-phosphate-mannose--protein O-mannosyl transferase